MVLRSSGHASSPMRNNDKPPATVPALRYRENRHTPFTAQSYRTLPPSSFSSGINASDDADSDNVSIYSEASGQTTDSPDTAIPDTDDEDKDCEPSSTESRSPSPDTALARHHIESSPTAMQVGYFVFPRPFSSGKSTSSSPENTRSHATSSPKDEESIVEEKSEVADYNSFSSRNVSLGESFGQNSTAPPKKETKRFLPLLVDEPCYPRNPILNRGLEKVNKRLTKAAAFAEEQLKQPSKPNPIEE